MQGSPKRDRISIKHVSVVVLAAILILLAGCSGAGSTDAKRPESTGTTEEAGLPETAETAEQGGTEGMFYAYVNGSILKIKAADNPSADAFLDLLKAGDVTVDMHDYGGFEKVGPLGTDLPRSDERITTEAGDVILYQGDQITIYYDVNNWSFTRLGKVQGLSQDELKEMLGEGDACVRFSLVG